MGKKSRQKKEIKRGVVQALPDNGRKGKGERKTALESFFLWLVYLSAAFSLLTPFIMGSETYFPFVGPKGIYLMACCSIAFFAWLVLAIYFPKYRPKITSVLAGFAIFILVLILSSILGQDFSRSFWSKFERMTGLLVWLCLFGFFLALSNSFKTKNHWRNLFILSAAIGVIISFCALMDRAGVDSFDVSKRGGFTLGNTSFLGTYLLFNFFFAIYLFSQTKSWLKWFFAASLVLNIAAIYLSNARAASIACLAGAGLIFLLWLSFKIKPSKKRTLGRIVLGISAVVVLIAIILLLIPNSPVQQKFAAIATRSRAVNWKISLKGFSDKPMFGWGLENYYLLFPKYFNPCLFTPDCGSEVWFDRTHNIVFDTLVANGILGLIAYLALLFVGARALARARQKDFWLFACFISLIAAYFVQNLTVFDMPVSLLLFVVVLALSAWVQANSKTQRNQLKEPAKILKTKLPILGASIVFFVCFFQFVIQPARADHLVIETVRAQTIPDRLAMARKTLQTSASGKYQIRDFFAEQFLLDIQRNFSEIMKDETAKKFAVEELDFLVGILEQTRRESPLDYSAVLKLAQTYNLYVSFDYSKVSLAEEAGQAAMALSPNNQQSYWTLAQTYLYMGKYDETFDLTKKAIDLEPKWFASWEIAIQAAQKTGKPERVQELARAALALVEEEISKAPERLTYYQSAVYFAEQLGATEKAKQLARMAIAQDPTWVENFQDILGEATSTSGQ